MKTHQLLFLLAIAVCTFSCSGGNEDETKASTPLSEQQLEFEIYDSLVVDYLGNLTLMDISPDGNTFLLMDQNSSEILITDEKGSILNQYNRSGEGPDAYGSDKSGKATFISNTEYLIPTTRNVVQYDIEGNLIRKIEPDFQGMANLIITASKSVIKRGNNLYFKIEGRSHGEDDFNEKNSLEKVNFETGEFTPIIPFPKTSKFMNEELEFAPFDYFPIFDVSQDSLFFMFRNEPKLFSYSLDNLDSPAYSKKIPFEEFIERKTDNSTENGGFNLRDFLLGSVNDLVRLEDGSFLLFYTSGLTDDQAAEVTSEAGTDFNKIFSLAEKYNETGYVLFDGVSTSNLIERKDLLNNIAKVVSKDEIWFNLNFSEAENDYSVIYKTRIVEK